MNISDEQDKLVKAINRLDKSTRLSNNLGLSFVRGVVYSIGTVLGIAVITALTIFLLSKIGKGNAIGQFFSIIVNVTRKN